MSFSSPMNFLIKLLLLSIFIYYYYFLVYLIIPIYSFECSYGKTNIIIPCAQPFFFMPPKCDSPITSYRLEGNLPSGIEFINSNGGFKGYTFDNSTTPYSVVVVANYYSASLSLPLTFSVVVDSDEDDKGWTVIYGHATDNANITFIDMMYDGTVPYYINHLSKGVINCNPVESDFCAEALDLDVRYINFLAYASFKVEVEEEWTFKIAIDDIANLYIDSMTEIKRNIYLVTAYYYITLKPGWHFIMLNCYNHLEKIIMEVEFSAPSVTGRWSYHAADGTYFTSRPPAFQYMDWRTNDLVLVQGQPQTLTPLLSGYVKNWTVVPELPNGMNITKYGQIDGTPVSVTAEQTHTITALSLYGESMSTTMEMRVIDADPNKMSLGFDGLYYLSVDRECSYRAIDSTKDTLEFRRIDTEVNHPNYEAQAWSGLSGNFISSFTVDWTGLLKVDTSSVYTIYMTVNGGARLEINNVVIETVTCSGSEVQGTVTLEAGIVNVKLYYWKESGDATKRLILEWSSIEMSRQQIPNANFLHIPRYTFSYTYETASYVKGVRIADNCPIFSIKNPSDYTIYTYTPLLPEGLNIDPITHCITGTITESAASMLPTYYVITATGSSSSQLPLYSRMTISYDTYIQPISIVYPDINVRIGTYVSSIPTVIANQYVVQPTTSLPHGLSINALTGEIFGYPTEDISTIITLTVTNAAGSVSGTVRIIITDCTVGEHFLHLKYISGSSDGLTVSAQTNGQSVYYKDEHNADSEYEFYQCSPYQTFDILFTQSRGRGGSYYVYQKKNILLKYGEFNVGITTTLNINLGIISGLPSVSYPQTSFSFVTGEYIDVYPTILSSSVTEYVLSESSSLPGGLYLDSTNGRISGTVGPVVSGSGTVQIIIKNENGQITQTLTYTHTAGCMNEEILLNIVVYGGASAEVVKLVVSSSGGNIIWELNGLAYSTYKVMSKCVAKGNYIAQFSSSDNSAWAASTYIVVNNRDTLLGRLSFRGGRSPSTFNFLLLVPIATSAAWNYASVYTPGWNSDISTSWPSSNAGNFNRPSSAITMYYRINVNFDSLVGFGRFELRIKSDTGMICYINGVEMFRKNMPQGDITPTTMATGGFDTNIYFYLLGIPEAFVTGTNVIAFELHKYDTTLTENDPFLVRLSIFGSDSSCTALVNGYLDIDPAWTPVSTTLSDLYGGEGSANIFDMNPETKVTIKENDLPNNHLDIVAKFNNRFISFTSYSFVTGGDCYDRDPSTWVLYAAPLFNETDEDTEWIELDNVSNVILTDTRKAVVSFHTNGISTPFEAIKISIRGRRGGEGELWYCTSEHIQFADFYPSSCGIAMCVASDPFPATPAGQNASVPCSAGSSYYRTRECLEDATWGPDDISQCVGVSGSITYPTVNALPLYSVIDPIVPTIEGLVININAVLPNELYIDKDTGIITGIPRVPISGTRYVITAETTSGQITTTVFIQTSSPTCEGSNVEVNNFEIIRCPVEQSGYQQRECLPSSPPSWDEWDISDCTDGRSPRCNISQPNYQYQIGDYVQITTACEYSYSGCSIDNPLPNGLTFIEASCSIQGTVTSPLRNSQYSIHFTSSNGGYDDVKFNLGVYGVISSCSYVYVGYATVFESTETLIEAPDCDNEVTSYSGVDLPGGFTVNNNGTITVFTPVIGNYTFIMIASNPLSTYNINVSIAVIRNLRQELLLGKFPTERITRTPNYAELWAQIENNEIEYEWAVAPDGFSNWKSDVQTFTFGTSVVRERAFAAAFSGRIELPSSGTWQFALRSTWCIALFLDTFDSVKGSRCAMYGRLTVTVNDLDAGFHDIGVMIYVDDYKYSNQINEMLWKGGSMTDFEFIPDSAFSRGTGLLRAFSYPSNEYIFINGIEIDEIVPELEGDYTNIIAPSSFPHGLVFTNGIITGTPTASMLRTKYTIECHSLTNTIEDEIYITIISLTKNNLLSGVLGKYYTNPGTINCSPFVDPSSDSMYSLGYQRVIPNFYHEPSVDIWTGLSTAFSTQYYVKWEGFLDVPEAGTYTFFISAQDGARIDVNNGAFVLSVEECGLTSTSGSTILTSGLKRFLIYYWKTANSVTKSISVKWTKSGGSSIQLQDIPDDNLYFNPSHAFTYSYEIATYVANRDIEENNPLFYQVYKELYQQFYCTEPLPTGIVLNALSGRISGRPTTSHIRHAYTIVAVANDGNRLTTTVTITVNPYLPPRNLVYDTVVGSISEEITPIVPSLDNSDYVSFRPQTRLPTGIS